jgi:hypothetical protein
MEKVIKDIKERQVEKDFASKLFQLNQSESIF